MHEMRTIAIDDPVAWASVSLSVTRATVLTHAPDGATSMRPLVRSVATCYYYSVRASAEFCMSIVFSHKKTISFESLDLTGVCLLVCLSD